MPRRKTPPVSRRVRDLASKMEELARVSPTTGELLNEWINRLLAGEPFESIKPEMDRLAEIYKANRRRR